MDAADKPLLAPGAGRSVTDSGSVESEDALEWGYGPLAAAQQGRSLSAPTADLVPGVPPVDQAAAPSLRVEHHGALARAAAVRAAGGRRRQLQRRKKDKKTGFKASELLSRQPADQQEDMTAAHDAVRVSGSQVATRQPFGAVPTTHRRRTGGRTFAGASDSNGGGSRHGPAGAVVVPQPAQGFAGLTKEQLAVVQDIFERVDSGNKGWLCRDDVQQIVRTLNNSDTTHPKRDDTGTANSNELRSSRAQERTMQHDRLLPRLGCPPRNAPIDAAAEREQRKQDSAREPTSPIPDDDTARYGGSSGTRWASRSAMTEEAIEQQVKQAEKKQIRDARRRRKLVERETTTTIELLKVLVPPDSVELWQASGAGAEPPVRLSFDTFSKAVDVAMVRTSIMPADATKPRAGGGGRDQGTTSTGARPGELYCRKMVKHWRQARVSDRSNDLGSGGPATHAPAKEAGGRVGADSYEQMLELLVPLDVRDAREAIEEEIL
jgi:hypothetical protein